MELTTKEKIDIMQAYLDGRTICCRSDSRYSDHENVIRLNIKDRLGEPVWDWASLCYWVEEMNGTYVIVQRGDCKGITSGQFIHIDVPSGGYPCGCNSLLGATLGTYDRLETYKMNVQPKAPNVCWEIVEVVLGEVVG